MIDRLPLCSTAICAAAILVNVSEAGEVGADGRWLLALPETGRAGMVLPELGRNITAAYLSGDPKREPIVVGFNQDASEVTLAVPDGAGGSLVLEVAEETRQFPDGRIVFSALDATVDGTVAKLESHPGNHRIGFWTELEDSVQ